VQLAVDKPVKYYYNTIEPIGSIMCRNAK